MLLSSFVSRIVSSFSRIFWVTFALALFFDVFTKLGATYYLSGQTIDIFGHFFQLKLVYNDGIAFSINPWIGLFFPILTVVLILSLVIYFIFYEPRKNEPALQIAYALLFWGALGNAFERLFIGKVTDFLSVKFFAIFNVADIFITISAFIFVFYAYFRPHPYERNAN